MKEKRVKKKVTTYFKEDSLNDIDNYCKAKNISRTDFLLIASKYYINAVNNDLNLLSLAYYSYSDCNWLKNEVDSFLHSLYDCYIQDEQLIKEVIKDFNINDLTEYPNMIDLYGFEFMCKLLIRCIEKEVSYRNKRHKLA